MGVRRVQEVFTDAKEGTVPETIKEGDPPANPDYFAYTAREYIWSPGGAAPGYVDEIVCQVTHENVAEYVLQDGNYNVVTLVSPLGGGGTAGGEMLLGFYRFSGMGGE